MLLEPPLAFFYFG